MNYWSRATPPHAFAPVADRFDAMVEDVVRKLFKLGSLGESARNQMILPIRLGGFGLTKLKLVSPVAWLCSFGLASKSLINSLPPNTVWKNGWLEEEIEDALKVAGGLPLEFGVSFPTTKEHFWARCKSKKGLGRLQGRLMEEIWRRRYDALLKSHKVKSNTYTRLVG